LNGPPQAAEKLNWSRRKYQGTTSVVPIKPTKQRRPLAPAKLLVGNSFIEALFPEPVQPLQKVGEM
jgi:hypothetical protein